MFRNRLTKVAKHIGKLAKKRNVTCYRVYDHDLPEFPVCIEFYDDKLYVAEYKRNHGMEETEHEEWLNKSIEAISDVLDVKTENIFLKLRQRKEGRAGQYQKTDERKQEFIIHENGLKFIVNLGDYLDTGLFLDHRDTRQLVREQSDGKRVLNLFAYTGSFSVYAAAGNAEEVVTVDLSKTYLDWAERNMKLNGFENIANYKFHQADIKKYLRGMPAGYYDLIIMDPPTFSNSKRMDDFLDIQKDHVELINNCLKALKQGGLLYFSTNYRKFVLDTESIDASTVKDITRMTTPFDFEGKLFRVCYQLTR